MDDVLFDAPYEIAEDFLSSLRISSVVKGSADMLDEDTVVDPFHIPRDRGILRVIDVVKKMSGELITYGNSQIARRRVVILYSLRVATSCG